jgi:hypothetical protein
MSGPSGFLDPFVLVLVVVLVLDIGRPNRPLAVPVNLLVDRRRTGVHWHLTRLLFA